MNKLTRRRFAQTAAATAATAWASVSLPQMALAHAPSAELLKFPSNFLWGCATASYQIEGGASEDGRKPSVWDTFSHTPGKTHQGDTGDVADDSYHRYKEDVQLLKNLGAKVYRFSISWSRIFPDGTGQPNEKGLAYYQRVVDELLANGIEPYVTLFHWDLPQALPNGWQSRDTAKAFADYAAYVSKRLSDRVSRFFTTNEFVCFTDLSYKIGQFAPGLKLPPAEVNQIRHPCKCKAGNEGRPCGKCERLRTGHRKQGAHRGDAQGNARGERSVPHGPNGGQVYRRIPGARGCERAQS
jgi:beta-glucosidase